MPRDVRFLNKTREPQTVPGEDSEPYFCGITNIGRNPRKNWLEPLAGGGKIYNIHDVCKVEVTLALQENF